MPARGPSRRSPTAAAPATATPAAVAPTTAVAPAAAAAKAVAATEAVAATAAPASSSRHDVKPVRPGNRETCGGSGGGRACAAGVPPNNIAPVSAPAPTAPAAALRADRREIIGSSFRDLYLLSSRTLPINARQTIEMAGIHAVSKLSMFALAIAVFGEFRIVVNDFQQWQFTLLNTFAITEISISARYYKCPVQSPSHDLLMYAFLASVPHELRNFAFH